MKRLRQMQIELGQSIRNDSVGFLLDGGALQLGKCFPKASEVLATSTIPHDRQVVSPDNWLNTCSAHLWSGERQRIQVNVSWGLRRACLH